jgi:hypothetical protein
MSRFTDLIISVQARRAGGPPKNHLAAGLLVGPKAILIPEPGDKLADGDLEVLISARPPETEEAERIAATRLTLLSLNGGPPIVGHLQLAEKSRHPVPSATGTPRLEQGETNLWRALERAGIVPVRYRGPSQAELGKLPSGSVDRTDMRRENKSVDTHQGVERGVCKWVKFCDRQPFDG